MPRKLKTFVTNLGFFELAIAAPSMKAALEAWGLGANAFKQGFAKETDDAKIVAATMAMPGAVLKRPVGTTGAFTHNADLPTLSNVLSRGPVGTPKRAERPRKAQKPKRASHKAKQADRADVISFEAAKAKREQAREAEEARQEAQGQKGQTRIERATAKAQAALESAREHHEATLAAIEKERDKLDRRAKIEEDRWDKERRKLEEARERAARWPGDYRDLKRRFVPLSKGRRPFVPRFCVWPDGQRALWLRIDRHDRFPIASHPGFVLGEAPNASVAVPRMTAIGGGLNGWTQHFIFE
jgi:colicin import membrane protein